MSGVLRRSSNLLRTLRNQGLSFGTQQVSQSHHLPGSQKQSGHYFGKFPNFSGKMRGSYDLSPVTLSFSAAARSFKVGPVEWYLGMVKSRPIVTKGVTCALIYIAADLSSQVKEK